MSLVLPAPPPLSMCVRCGGEVHFRAQRSQKGDFLTTPSRYSLQQQRKCSISRQIQAEEHRSQSRHNSTFAQNQTPTVPATIYAVANMSNDHQLWYERREGGYLHRNSIGGSAGIGTDRIGEGRVVPMAENGDSRIGHRHSMPSALMRIGGDKKPSSFVPFPNTTPPPTASRHLPSSSMSRTCNREVHSPHHLEDRRNDDGSSSHPSRGGQRHIVEEERSDVIPSAAIVDAAHAKTPSPRPTLPPTPPRRGGRHTSWPLSSLYRPRSHPSGPSSTDPLSALYPRTPSPISSRQGGGISPPEPRRILCGKSLFSRDIDDTKKEGRGDEGATFPVQTRYSFGKVRRTSLEAPLPFYNHEVVGHPSLKIHRLKLPSYLLPLLDTIVSGCEMHASTLPTGWQTDLYSLTKQDIALREIPHIYNAAKPVISYIQKTACLVYGITSGIKMDRNQPHVLKYNHCQKGRGHTGVELHHDKCDMTVNLMLSRPDDYSGGGTYFPSADTVVRLEFGEFVLHPGGLVHGGVNITQGNRVLMVMFVDEVK